MMRASIGHAKRAWHSGSRFWRPSGRSFCAGASTNASSAGRTSLLDIAKTHPFKFQVGIAIVKTSAADLMAQVAVEKKTPGEINWKRNMIFVVFGGAYLGCFQGWLMLTQYGKWFPTMGKFAAMPISEKVRYTAGMVDAAKMLLFDIFVHLPFMYFPCFYITKEFVFEKSWNPVDWFKQGLTKWQSNFKQDFVALVKLWGPSDCIQFAIPVWMRMPFRHAVSFFWTAYVSYTRAK